MVEKSKLCLLYGLIFLFFTVFGWSESFLGHVDNVTSNENGILYQAVSSALENVSFNIKQLIMTVTRGSYTNKIVSPRLCQNHHSFEIDHLEGSKFNYALKFVSLCSRFNLSSSTCEITCPS